MKYKLLKYRLISWYSIFLGIAVFGMWAIILINGNISEGRTEMGFHLFSEFLMASICILSGVFLLSGWNSAIKLNVIGLGMLLYSLINAAGYYGQRDDIPMMFFFIILMLLTGLALFMHFSRKP